MNKVIVGQKRKEYRPKKDSSLDILSLADYLHQSQFTSSKKPQLERV